MKQLKSKVGYMVAVLDFGQNATLLLINIQQSQLCRPDAIWLLHTIFQVLFQSLLSLSTTMFRN